MKKPRDLFKNKEYLLDEPEVEQLLDYCEQLQDEIVEFKFDKNNDKQLIMLDLLKEILKGCNEAQKQQAEHLRFGLEAPNFEESINNLKSYILERCKEEKIWIH
jgi:hypothetical protein